MTNDFLSSDAEQYETSSKDDCCKTHFNSSCWLTVFSNTRHTCKGKQTVAVNTSWWTHYNSLWCFVLFSHCLFAFPETN